MIDTESQKAEILEWMLDGNRITGLLALKMFRSMRLPARIKEIKKAGYQVSDRFITVEDRESGKRKRVKEYWIETRANA